MIRIYIVEDNTHLLEDITLCLNAQGFDCYGSPDAQSFNTLISKRIPDVVVLDWMLPDESGLAIAQKLRNNNQTKAISIIFLTARSDIGDRIAGLEFADAYHVKPIDYRELGAVISSIYRRSNTVNSQEKNLIWRLHKSTLALHSPDDQVLHLSHREFILLRELARSTETPVSAKQIIEFWGEDWMLFEKNRLELLLSRLRTKIKHMNGDTLNPIRTIRNEGYKLMIPIQIHD
ncbi:MAG: response regulator transcription factor [Methyloprofundus sp.]|nr:response regulator transcription factor [Methyloprofundus sp.]MDT8425758.1 response regulator transcription factor [Methyloprofundus sp.]